MVTFGSVDSGLAGVGSKLPQHPPGGEEHPRLELLYGARYSPHDNPVERIWGALKNYVANTAVTWPGPPKADPRVLPRPLTGPAAGPRRALDQPLAAARLRGELLECRLACFVDGLRDFSFPCD